MDAVQYDTGHVFGRRALWSNTIIIVKVGDRRNRNIKSHPALTQGLSPSGVKDRAKFTKQGPYLSPHTQGKR